MLRPPHSAFIYLLLFLWLLSQLLLLHRPRSAMGTCISIPNSDHDRSINTDAPMKISLPFQLPSPLPTWPKGRSAFGTGAIDLGGGLQVAQVTTFKKIWSSLEGGPENLGMTLFEPSPVPEGFSLLGCYAQPNNKPLFGWVLVGKEDKDSAFSTRPLANPTDYTLVWNSSSSSNIKQDGPVFIWLPVPPDGYKAVGYAVTTTADKPPLDRIRCVLANLTDQAEPDGSIWATTNNGFNIYSSKPTNISVTATGVGLGTFIASSSQTTKTTNSSSSSVSISCLKNTNPKLSCAMPDAGQIKALIEAYSPFIYLHPDEQYSPSTVNWLFANGGLLYKKGDESNPTTIQPNGANLPQGGSNDGAYWLDLPTSKNEEERVKKGDLDTAGCYFHVKPMLGGTFTDLAMWIYYPFNGPARAKIGLIKAVSLGKIGEHVGDWEHVTLRISNFNGELRRVYFSEHSKGTWKEPGGDLEFQNGNRVVAYSSLHGHAMYSKPGLVLQGNELVGIRNDTERSGFVLDTAKRYEVISADYEVAGVVEPPWVNYMREWGPKISYDLGKEIGKITRFLPSGKLKKEFETIVRSLPAEVLGEQGPIGPKGKKNWYGDELV